MDRGYAKFKLFNNILAAGLSDVCRLRDRTVAEVVQDHPPTEADHVLLGQIVRFNKSGNKATDQPHDQTGPREDPAARLEREAVLIGGKERGRLLRRR